MMYVLILPLKEMENKYDFSADASHNIGIWYKVADFKEFAI